MERSRTITDAKAAFIRTQVRLLSAPLVRSSQWRDFADEPEQGHLSNKVVDEVMSKGISKSYSLAEVETQKIGSGNDSLIVDTIVNEKLKLHNRMVYSIQSQRHVAEQIDALYMQEVSKERLSTEIDTIVVDQDVDLTSSEYDAFYRYTRDTPNYLLYI